MDRSSIGEPQILQLLLKMEVVYSMVYIKKTICSKEIKWFIVIGKRNLYKSYKICLLFLSLLLPLFAESITAHLQSLNLIEIGTELKKNKALSLASIFGFRITLC